MGLKRGTGLEGMGMGVEQLVELMEAAEEERALHLQMALESNAAKEAPTALLGKLAEAEDRITQLEKENQVLLMVLVLLIVVVVLVVHVALGFFCPLTDRTRHFSRC
jgi:hypothetical protein